MTRVALASTLAVAALAALASSATADLPAPGPNGSIVFTSGRDDGATVLSNALAQLWTVAAPGGTALRRTPTATRHHRHPAWSPDHTQIAYAEGPSGFVGPWDIWIRDVTRPISLINPRNLTNSALSEDRPAWSPDGTRIVYQQGNAAMSTNVNIKVRAADGSGGETTVAANVQANGDASSFFPRPHWTPDSQTIFYAFLDGAEHDIYRTPADGSDTDGTGVITANTTDDYQPMVSPDGTRLCFTRQEATNKEVFISSVAGGLPGTLLAIPTTSNDEYECAWSPDQTLVSFTRGAQDQGQILMASSSGTGPVTFITDVPARFDGNQDWAMNPPPICLDTVASVAFNSFVSIQLVCTDVPEPFQTDPEEVNEEIVSTPPNGVLGALNDERVIYTPNANFQGQDSFTFKGNDGTSESNVGTARVTVGGPVVGPPGAATVDALSMAPRRWRRGSELPTFSQSPVGTRIGVQLSAAGRVTLAFRRARPGRRVSGRCVKPTRRNRARRRCTRYVRAGSLSFDGKQGANSVRFQGRLSARRRLALGRHRMSATVSAGGQTSPARTVSFRIVRR